MAINEMRCKNKNCRAYEKVVQVDFDKDNKRCAECNNALYYIPTTEIITVVGEGDDGHGLASALASVAEATYEADTDDVYWDTRHNTERQHLLPMYSGPFGPGSGPNKKYTPPPDDTFTCPADLKGCPIAATPAVYIPVDMYNKWVYLCKAFSTEWICYLKGGEVEGEPNNYVIEEMYFPKQKANGAHCDAEEGTIQEGTIASIHSHVGMKAFFSAEDEKHFNHLVEMVINRDGDIKAKTRIKLECGRFSRVDAEIIFSACEEEEALAEELSQQLSKESFSTSFTAPQSKAVS